MTRRDEIIGLLRDAPAGLDDDDIANRLGMNRVYVNRICRELADESLTSRFPGSNGKLVSRWTGDPDDEPVIPLVRPSGRPPRRRVKRSDRARSNVETLIAGFPAFVLRFERSSAFPGPSLYFHERALERRRLHRSASELVRDERFFEYVYAVLPAWGMHRMGKARAKVGDFEDMVRSFREAAPTIDALWGLRITDLGENEAPRIARLIWDVLGSLRVSTSATRIVAGSKALHHALPDLVPPIDRQYTFQFFTGQKAVTKGDERAFLEWFPYLAEIGRRASVAIDEATARGGFMATGPAKVIDNAIIGFMQGDDGELDAAGL